MSASDAQTIPFFYQNGRQITQGRLTIPETRRPDVPSAFLFAFHKSGSVLVNAILDAIAKESGVSNVALSESLFTQGVCVSAAVFDFEKLIKPYGYFYSGFRRPYPAMSGLFDTLPGTKLLVVRDPRDILVSNYFSVKYSHGYPANSTPQFATQLKAEFRGLADGLDSYCIRAAAALLKDFYDYLELLDAGAVVLRYEDFIYDKRALTRRLCELCLVDLPADAIMRISTEFETIPSSEDVNAHIRQVHPGDHKRKLQSSTIHLLDEILRDFLQTFGYDARAKSIDHAIRRRKWLPQIRT
jgi:hypothetical protein